MTCGNCEDCAFESTETSNKPIVYEFHLTVKNANIDKFSAACNKLGLKPLLLDLHMQNGSFGTDLMTSSTFKGPYRDAVMEMLDLSGKLKREGFNVIRQKIETVPWHPVAPSKENEQYMRNGQYLESHLGIKCTEFDYAKLNVIAKEHNMHLSKNAFKKTEESIILMSTLRWYQGTVEDFKVSLDIAAQAFSAAGFVVERQILEFVIYDSKESHDNNWLKAA